MTGLEKFTAVLGLYNYLWDFLPALVLIGYVMPTALDDWLWDFIFFYPFFLGFILKNKRHSIAAF